MAAGTGPMNIACVVAPRGQHIQERLVAALAKAECRLTPTCFADAPTALVAMRLMAVAPRIVLLQTCASGLDDAAAIKAVHRQLRGHPILAVSRELSATELLSFIRHGAAGCVCASASTDEIAQAIRQVLNGEFPISASLSGHLFRLAGSPLFDVKERPIQLTAREQEVLSQLALGYTYAETAAILGTSLSTVQTHVRSIYSKFGCRTLVQALNRARQNNLL